MSTIVHAVGIGLAAGWASALHCAAMCGPLASAVCGGERPAARVARYQLGRAVGYTTAGFAMGVLGARVAQHMPNVALLPALSALLLTAMAVKLLLQARRGPRPGAAPRSVPPVPAARLTRGPRRSALVREPALLGLLSAVLPCGALGSAWLLAAMAGSATAGAGVMIGFALASGSSVIASVWLMRRIGGVRTPALARAFAVLLLAAAVWTSAPLLSSTRASANGQHGVRCH